MKIFLQKIMSTFIALVAIYQVGISQCTVDAGTISTTDPTTICVDGIPDPINVTVSGSTGSESAWIITDAGNNILATPPGGPFDLDGAGGGVCLIWYISHDGTLAGNTVGNNISDLTGCFDLSNEITVTRNEPIGGTLAGGPYEFCVGDGEADNIPMGAVTVSGNQGDINQWVVTDDQRNILGLPPSPDAVNFDGAGGGMCYIYNVSYYGTVTGLAVGMSLNDIGGCVSESDNFITVVRNEPDGGSLSTNDETTICVDGIPDPIDVTVEDAEGANAQWIITNDTFLILAKPAGPPFDLDGAGPGTCLIWYMRYDGTVMGDTLGGVLDSISGCFDLSDSIAVIRNEPMGGSLAGGPFEFCIDGEADNIPAGAVTVSGNVGETSQWVITDDQMNILGLPPSPDVVNFDGAGPGQCYIFNVSYYGTVTGLAMGMNLNDVDGCIAQSDFIVVTRNEPMGGTLAGGPFEFCIDGEADNIPAGAVTVSGNVGETSQWVITDDQMNILGLPPSPDVVNFDGAGPGQCYIFNVSYYGTVTGLAMGMNLNDVDGCIDQSNFIVVTRNEPMGGTLAGGPFEFCIDGEADNIPAGAVTVSGNVGETSQWVITDDQMNILGLPPSPDVVNFDGAGPGQCYIFNVSYYGAVTGLAMGMNLNDVDGCIAQSDFIVVTRNEPMGGTLAGGPFEFCIDGEADNIPAGAVTVSGNVGETSQWVITDDQMNILGLPPSPDVVNFDGAGPGQCYIFNVSYYGTVTGLEMGMNLNNVDGCIDQSNFIVVTRNEPMGGTLAGGPFEFCIDGEADNIPAGAVTVSGNVGETSQWVITDDQMNILGLPPSPEAVNFDGAGPGMCYIFNVSYYGTVTGLEMGMNLNNVDGCIDQSNFIVVTRNEPMGGTLTGGPFTFCIDGEADNIPAGAVTVSGNVGQTSQWVITDDQRNILGLPPSPDVVNFDGAGVGMCYIFNVSYYGAVSGLEMGANLDDLEGCVSESSNFITVIRDAVDGASVSLLNGETIYSNCPGNVVFDVQNTTENIYFNYYYVITNDDDVILGFVDASTTSTLDLSAAPAGECHVWGWNSIGTTTPTLGDHISSLEGESCEELSDNFITVLRTLPDGGYITLDDGTTAYEGCAGEIDFDLTFETSTFHNYWFVVTDDNSNILAWFNSDNGGWIDINGAPPGVCRIYGWNEQDLPEPVVGAHISSLSDPQCGEVSENFVTINRLDCENGCEVEPAIINTVADNVENRVVIANRGSGTVSVIDADKDEVITTYDMPNEGEPMYVVYNNSNNTYLVGDYFGYVAAYDANDNSLKGVVEAGNGVFHMWISPDNSQLWVNNELDRTISVINPTTLENIATVEMPSDLFDLGYKPHDVILMPNNEAAFVTFLGTQEAEDYVVKYSTTTFEETERVAVGKDPHVVLTPSNDKLYVAAQGADLLYVLNRSDLSLVTQIDVPNAHGLGVNASGTYVYIGNISEGGSNATYTLDLSTNELVGDPVDAPFSVPHNYATIGDDKLYVTHSGGANFKVSVYDLTPTPVLNTTIDVQSNPFGLAAFSITNTDEVAICVDGVGDPIDVNVEGGSGMNSAWVITDNEGNILALPPMGPFDLDGAGEGVCLIWYLTYDDVEGVEVGLNANDLEGCFALSNPITVIREAADGGMVALASGGTEATYCAGDVVFDVSHETTASNLSYWYIITDDNDNILAYHNTADGPTLDLSGAPAGECHVWGWSYNGEDLPVMGDHISTLADGSCEAISSNYITISRITPSAAVITTMDDTTICVDGEGDPINVDVEGGSGSNSAWVITDTEGNILGLPPTGPFDLDGAGEGVCLIWYLTYENVTGVEVGLNTNDLEGCYALSNAITVTRESANGGMVSLAEGGTEVAYCAGDIVFDVTHETTAQNLSYWYIITDNNDNILAYHNTANGSTLDLSGAPAGECHIWGWSYKGEDLPVMGENISTLADGTCEAISDNFITVFRETPDGGMVLLTDGTDAATFEAGDVVFDVAHTTSAPYLSYWYIITDADDNILAFHNSADGPTLDLSGAPAGECHIWGWNYKGLADPVVGEHISTLGDDFCEAISENFITITRTEPSGPIAAIISTVDETTICVNGIGDPINVTVEGGQGENSAYVITDVDGNILGLPPMGPFDLDGAGEGVCLIWHLNYTTVEGLEVGMNTDDLSGEFAFSNYIEVIRQSANGGEVSLTDGSTEATFIAGDVVFDVEHETTATALSYWYIITDDSDNILAYHNSTDGPTLDLSGAPIGECHIWGWSYKGEPNPAMGENISTLADGDCEAISDNFIRIIRTAGVAGATISTDDETTICVDGEGDPIEINVAGGQGENSAYVITDVDGNILGLPPMGPFDLDGAGEGVCLIWHLNYLTIEGLEVGLNTEDLTGEYAFSNAITVTRQAADGGVVALTNGLDTATYCVGEVVFDVMHETNADALGYWYVITDNNDNILAVHNTADGPTLDLSAAPAGECHIWGWSSNGETVPVLGESITSLNLACGSISANFISIFRAEGIIGGTISTESSTVTCPNDGEDDLVNITTTGSGEIYAYILTDENDVIMGSPTLTPSINFENMEPGIARIYGLGYAGQVEIGNSITDINGTCTSLSLNFIEVIIQESAECAVTSTHEIDEEDVRIYPNPAVNYVTLEYNDLSDNAYINVFDAQGKVVLTQYLTNNSGSAKVDVQDLLGGIYMVRVISEERFITKRILITK